MVNNFIILFAGMLILGSCSLKKLDPEQYMKWINDPENGLIKVETFGPVKYTVAYRPVNYLLAKAMLDQDSFAIKSNKFLNHSFIVKMEPVDGKTQVLTLNATGQQEPFQRINYYLSEAQNYFTLTEGKDTLKAVSYVYERYYNLSPSQNLVIGFSQKKILGSSDLVFTLEDKVFNTGQIHFYFNASTLSNIPQLTKQ